MTVSSDEQQGPRWTTGLGFLASFAVVAAGSTATLLVTGYEDEVRARDLRARADLVGDVVTDQLASLVETEIGGAAATAAALSVDPGLDRAAFRRYAASVEDQLPTVLGVGYVRRVAAAEVDDFVARARADGAPDFAVRDLTDGPEHAILLYNEPAEELRSSWGVDVSAVEEAARTLQRATDEGRTAVTERVVLAVDRPVPAGRRRAGYVAYAPVFAPDMPTATMEERRAAVVGWSNLPFRAQDLLDLVRLPEGVRVTVREGGVPVAVAGPEIGDGAASSVHEMRSPNARIGWAVEASVPVSVIEPSLDRSATALVVGSGLTAVLAVLVGLVARGSRRWALTARRALRTATRSEERLRRSNQDLAAIAAVAAHDLSEPLTVIGGYADLLEQRYPVTSTVDVAAASHLRTISEAAQRMRAMLDALLHMSSIGGEDTPLSPVPLGPVVDDALANLEAALSTSGAEVVVGPLPTVQGRRDLLVELLQNLLANAVRHGRSDRPLRIAVDAEREPAAWRITVADNGRGVPAAQRSRIFEAFRRLDHSAPGLGIGLSIARRIVQLHEGSIEVRDGPDGGAAFTFTIPDRRHGHPLDPVEED